MRQRAGWRAFGEGEDSHDCVEENTEIDEHRGSFSHMGMPSELQSCGGRSFTSTELFALDDSAEKGRATDRPKAELR